MEYMYYDNRAYNDNMRYIQEAISKDNKTHIFRQVGGYPTREELVAEAKAVFSEPTSHNRIYDVKRIRDNTGTTVELQGKLLKGKLHLCRPNDRLLSKALEDITPKKLPSKKSLIVDVAKKFFNNIAYIFKA